MLTMYGMCASAWAWVRISSTTTSTLLPRCTPNVLVVVEGRGRSHGRWLREAISRNGVDRLRAAGCGRCCRGGCNRSVGGQQIKKRAIRLRKFHLPEDSSAIRLLVATVGPSARSLNDSRDNRRPAGGATKTQAPTPRSESHENPERPKCSWTISSCRRSSNKGADGSLGFIRARASLPDRTAPSLWATGETQVN